jgi:predicted nucleic acid-binding protein
VIVLDASVALEWLLQTPSGAAISKQISSSGEKLYAPHLVDVEVCQVLRRYVANGTLDAPRAEEALRDLADLRMYRYPHVPLLRRAWELRGNLTAYDAMYVALAEALDAILLTRDGKLAAAPGHRARIQLVSCRPF